MLLLQPTSALTVTARCTLLAVGQCARRHHSYFILRGCACG